VALATSGELSGTIGAAATSATVTKPTGLAAGDRWVIFLAFSNNASGTITWPSGFSAIPSATEPTASGSSSAAVRMRTADGSEGADVSVTWVSGTSGSWLSFAVPATSGVEAAGVNSGTATTSHVAPTVTPLGTGRLLVGLFAADAGGAGVTVTYSAGSSGMTEEIEHGIINTASSALYTLDLAGSSAATGTKTVTASASVAFVAYSLLFAPLQYHRPASDVSTTGWTRTSVGGSLASAIDDDPTDDADYVSATGV
jgi:hypothetical protein